MVVGVPRVDLEVSFKVGLLREDGRALAAEQLLLGLQLEMRVQVTFQVGVGNDFAADFAAAEVGLQVGLLTVRDLDEASKLVKAQEIGADVSGNLEVCFVQLRRQFARLCVRIRRRVQAEIFQAHVIRIGCLEIFLNLVQNGRDVVPEIDPVQLHLG